MVQPSLSSQSPVGSAAAGGAPTAIKAQAANVALRIERALITVSLDLHHPAILERHAAVHPLRQFHVVGGDYSGEPGGAHELGERVEDMACGARVEIPGRFVGEQDTRRIGNRARDRNALLLA